MGAMKRLPRLVLCIVAFALTAVAAHVLTRNPATKAVPREDKMALHEAFSAKARQGGIDLVFLGDSITAGWCDVGKATWDERYVPLKAANFGCGGDRTQHVLWRVRNGNFDGLTPKAVVLMIGTNNLVSHTAPQIAEGVAAIVKEIQARTPTTKILLLAVFPRAEKADDPDRVKIARINGIIAKLDDGQKVFYLDIGRTFLRSDGTLSKDVMPDFIHPSRFGYKIWADAIQDKLAELLK